MELAGCKLFCTVCLSFLPLHELRYKHLQTLASEPSAEAMLLAVLRATSRDQPGQPYSSAFLVCYIWKWGFCSRASSFVKHLNACLNAHLLRARNANSLRFLVARREAVFDQGHPIFQPWESQDAKGTWGGDWVVHNLCDPLCHELGTLWCRATPMANTDPK